MHGVCTVNVTAIFWGAPITAFVTLSVVVTVKVAEYVPGARPVSDTPTLIVPALDSEKLPVVAVGTSQALLETALQFNGSAHAPLAVSVTGCGVTEACPVTPTNVSAVGIVVTPQGADTTKLI